MKIVHCSIELLFSSATVNHFVTKRFIVIGLNKVYSRDIIVPFKQSTISCTTSQTTYMSTVIITVALGQLASGLSAIPI